MHSRIYAVALSFLPVDAAPVVAGAVLVERDEGNDSQTEASFPFVHVLPIVDVNVDVECQ
jgi:hypothetical protein